MGSAPLSTVLTRTYRDGSMCRLEPEGDGWHLEYFGRDRNLKFRHRLFGDASGVTQRADELIGLDPASLWRDDDGFSTE